MTLLGFIVAVVEFLYLVSLVGLMVYGLNNLVTTVIYMRSRGKPYQPPALSPNWELPKVTIQLPLYNERYMVERLLSCISRLDYPADKLQVQVLDDSTDDTALLVSRLVEQYNARGKNFELIHRIDRRGFKAGALTEGLKTATGELVGIFDADFAPEPDWLLRTVQEFRDPKLGCLQTRWGHLNHHYSVFTEAQSLGIDGHFIVEQTARSRNGLFLNFNGTAGLWRKAAIKTAGGWQSDTLTEDLDLSYRAQLRGWRIGYLPDVVVPAELPAQVEAFKQQQFRWAKGSFQAVKKLVPELLKEDMPWWRRLMGLIHITGYFVHPLMLTVLVLILPIGLYAPSFLKLFSWSAIATFGPPMMYMLARTDYTPRLVDRLRLLPFLILIGFGLSLNNSVAVFEGLFSKARGTFERTPKFNLTNANKEWAGNAYAMPLSPMVYGELLLAFYSLVVIVVLTPIVGWEITPWMLVYTAGYAYMAGLNIAQNLAFNHQEAAARL
ncbi:MAG TPA: glycosyltransferase [Longilinea sp.]|nr:glycosyltransferase [Longilinea sp.]